MEALPSLVLALEATELLKHSQANSGLTNMAVSQAQAPDALDTYEAMASIYDDFTAHFDTDGWISDLLKLLERYGLGGKRLLDVGCGTGESFIPMLSRGWSVCACDLSPAMLARAAEKACDLAELSIADMRSLPRFGEFDLVWALDDAVNYLLSKAELESALRGMRDNLAEGGLLLFDANELIVYRTYYAETSVVERGSQRFIWHGLGSADVASGSLNESRLEVINVGSRSVARELASTSTHRQRHFPEPEVREALTAARLMCVAVFGQGLDGIPSQPLDPSTHTKAIYIAQRV